MRCIQRRNRTCPMHGCKSHNQDMWICFILGHQFCWVASTKATREEPFFPQPAMLPLLRYTRPPHGDLLTHLCFDDMAFCLDPTLEHALLLLQRSRRECQAAVALPIPGKCNWEGAESDLPWLPLPWLPLPWRLGFMDTPRIARDEHHPLPKRSWRPGRAKLAFPSSGPELFGNSKFMVHQKLLFFWRKPLRKREAEFVDVERVGSTTL